jgi:hypothetical protein
MMRCPKCGSEVRPPPVRSSSQNRYYHLYLEVIARESGENADDLHEFFKRKLLPPVFKTIRGEEMKLPASTRDLGQGRVRGVPRQDLCIDGRAVAEPGGCWIYSELLNASEIAWLHTSNKQSKRPKRMVLPT